MADSFLPATGFSFSSLMESNFTALKPRVSWGEM